MDKMIISILDLPPECKYLGYNWRAMAFTLVPNVDTDIILMPGFPLEFKVEDCGGGRYRLVTSGFPRISYKTEDDTYLP